MHPFLKPSCLIRSPKFGLFQVCDNEYRTSYRLHRLSSPSKGRRIREYIPPIKNPRGFYPGFDPATVSRRGPYANLYTTNGHLKMFYL